ncbi:ATP-binding protein [Lactococcus lactis]|uniref:ATP-binding protein n=1 Tax=Lactococcus lactis TaxID=1358 RepID=UPI00223A742C|nr:ATP-binding protein [Lactococcus lactis]MCT1181489.1 ATP-binding protein [Lactococcus lactis]
MIRDTTEQIINLKFKDNSKYITFDISKNIVFYGLNGHGKTRVLKTIDSLIELCKESSIENSINIVNELNLEHLKIDGVDHKDLFNITQKIEEEQNKIIEKQFKKYEELFDLYRNNLSDFQHKILRISDSIPRILLKRLERLTVVEYPNKSNLQKLEFWLKDTYRCLREIARVIELDKEDFRDRLMFNIIEEDLNILLEINRKLHFSIFKTIDYSNYRNSKIHQEEMLSKKNNIITHLAIKDVIFISSENPNLDKIEQDINKKYTEAKESLFLSVYKGNSYNEYDNAINTIKSINSKKHKINEVIKKYADIKLFITENGNFIFNKRDSEIEYSKLSSGERRIIYLIMTIIFNDVDIYLVDEPEISLSLDYQNKIVNDLYQLTKNKTLMIATHAPFIYKDFQLLPNSINIEI